MSLTLVEYIVFYFSNLNSHCDERLLSRRRSIVGISHRTTLPYYTEVTVFGRLCLVSSLASSRFFNDHLDRSKTSSALPPVSNPKRVEKDVRCLPINSAFQYESRVLPQNTRDLCCWTKRLRSNEGRDHPLWRNTRDRMVSD